MIKKSAIRSRSRASSAPARSGIAWGLTERDLVPFSKDKSYTLVRNDFGPEYYYLGINVTKPPFNDIRVRQAFVYALNRERFVRSTLRFGEADSRAWLRTSPAYEKATKDAYAFTSIQGEGTAQAGWDQFARCHHAVVQRLAALGRAGSAGPNRQDRRQAVDQHRRRHPLDPVRVGRPHLGDLDGGFGF